MKLTQLKPRLLPFPPYAIFMRPAFFFPILPLVWILLSELVLDYKIRKHPKT